MNKVHSFWFIRTHVIRTSAYFFHKIKSMFNNVDYDSKHILVHAKCINQSTSLYEYNHLSTKSKLRTNTQRTIKNKVL